MYDSMIQKYIRQLRMKESAVNSSNIIGTARYIISHDNKSLLIENGGNIPSTVWAKSVMLVWVYQSGGRQKELNLFQTILKK